MNVAIVHNGVFPFLICLAAPTLAAPKCLSMSEKYAKRYCSTNFGDMNIPRTAVFDVVLRPRKGNCGMLLNAYFARVQCRSF